MQPEHVPSKPLRKPMTPMTKAVAIFAASLLAGAIASFGMAPYQFIPMLCAGLSFLYFAIASSESGRAAFLYGWAWGFGYFVAGLHWIGNALLVDGNPYAWAWPLAVCGLPFVLAIFFGVACWLAKSLSPIRTTAGYLSFTAFIGLCEFLRGHIFTGFPWNLFGYGWADVLEIPQIIYQTNIYFLSWLTVFWLAVPGFLWTHRRSLKSSVALAIVALLSFAAVYGYGALRLQNNPAAYHENVQVKLIQANIDQAEKWDGALMAQHVLKHLKMSAQNPSSSEDMTTFIIWPETAISYHFFEEDLYPGMIRDMLSSYGGKAYLVTGLLDYNKTDQTYANALALIDRRGITIDRYAKSHLVPFGEYIPFQDYIPLEPITQFSGFQPGDGAKLMTSDDGLSFAPSICYEGIFPGTLVNLPSRPDFIVNVTNDAWYGFSAGPYQHFTQTRFRAIEEGVPVIRSANTGISGVVDALGRIALQSDLFVDSAENIYLPYTHEENRIMKSFTIAFILMMLAGISFGYRLKMRNISQ